MAIIYIVNPVAGHGKAKALIPRIHEEMARNTCAYKIIETTGPKEAKTLACRALNEGYKTIVAVGGDGTISEVAAGIIESGYGNLGVIPAGTGNDLARSLDIPLEPAEALHNIIIGKVCEIDFGYAGTTPFINVASLGFDAEIVKNTESIKKRIRGKFAYTIGLITTLFTYKSQSMIFQFNDKRIEEDILLVAIGNGSYYGGGMKICPRAKVNDGVLDICVIKKIPKLLLLFIFPIVFFGQHGKLKRYVAFYKSNEVKIISKEKLALNIDGDIYDRHDHMHFCINPHKINIIKSN